MDSDQLIFRFRNKFGSRLFLDGVAYIFLGMKPSLRINQRYTAQFLEKEQNFIHATIVGYDGKPIVKTIIEVK